MKKEKFDACVFPAFKITCNPSQYFFCFACEKLVHTISQRIFENVNFFLPELPKLHCFRMAGNLFRHVA